MDIFVLDSSYTRVAFIESFTSFIWTERDASYGDFELKLPTTSGGVSAIEPGSYLYIEESDILMIIEKVVSEHDDENSEVLAVSGKSFESMLLQRIVSTNRKHSGGVARIATDLVRHICIDGNGVSSLDVIPDLTYVEQEGSATVVDADVQNKTLYDVVKQLCDIDKLAFRIHFDPDKSSDFLSFRVRSGTDRTTETDSDLAVRVVFGFGLENLGSSSIARSIENFKNVAYVVHDDRSNPRIVYRPGEDGQFIRGVNRRVLYVDASDLESPTNSELTQRGREALTEHEYQDLIDGEVDYSRTFRYGRDYRVGDYVEVRHPGGRSTKAKVIEHIWSFDSSGLRAYPTLQYVQDL